MRSSSLLAIWPTPTMTGVTGAAEVEGGAKTVPDYLPWKFGLRFCVNANGPSLASSESNTARP